MPPPAKRQKKNEDDLICPINLSLPLDPVTAEDGCIYERTAIEDYIERSQGGELTSPITREKMGPKLTASFKIKNTIETLIENGAITGELAEDWKKRKQQQQDIDDLLEKAEVGDVEAMECVAHYYECGKNGFKEDYKIAFKWYDKARVAGGVFGLVKSGDFLASGAGVAQDKMKAMMYLSRAEERGSDLAACILGMCLAKGQVGFPVDKVEARRLLEKSLSGNCPHKNMKDGAKAAAQQALDEIVNENA